MAERLKLTKAQRDALNAIEQSSRPRIRLQTGEALRKAGLVERETCFVVARDYATQDGVFPQWRGEEIAFHEWWLTTAGRQALRSSDGGKDA